MRRDAYSKTTTHKVEQIGILNLKDGNRDRLLVLLDLGDLGSLLGNNRCRIETLQQDIPDPDETFELMHMSVSI